MTRIRTTDSAPGIVGEMGKIGRSIFGNCNAREMVN